jgi:hypothetical protein
MADSAELSPLMCSAPTLFNVVGVDGQDALRFKSSCAEVDAGGQDALRSELSCWEVGEDDICMSVP